MKFVFIDAEKVTYAVRTLCRVLEVSRSGYYAWTRRRPTPRTQEAARLTTTITAIHVRSRRAYGSPRIHEELQARGTHVSRKRVARLMRQAGLVASPPTRAWVRTTVSNPTHPVTANILARAFTVEAPNQAWVTDITYIPTDDGWLYLAVILDLYARRVVGWATSERLFTALPQAALDRALGARTPDAGLIHHSDRGCQYTSAEYQARLAARGIVCSMSRKGNCWDNAVAESFFATLKREGVPADGFPSRAVAHAAIADYIETFYNSWRRHSHNGYLSPLEAELRWASPPRAA